MLRFVLLGIFLFTISLDGFSKNEVVEKLNQPASDKTVIEEEEMEARESLLLPALLSLYRPNYIMPFYYMDSPYQSIYIGNTPNNQKIHKGELKAQLSFLLPLLQKHFHTTPFSINVAYTQLMYWQVYAKSQYFRETNYEPELFIHSPINGCSAWQVGVNHQSNGRGSALERSWNRIVGEYSFAGLNWLVRARIWTLFAKADSSDLHNPRIAHFLGHDNVVMSYEWRHLNSSLKLQNLESGLKRGFVEASLSYPILSNVLVYGQFFHGYGQSLIEYDHKTTSFGIGVALKDWINR